jgi:hypothetical protein
MNLYNCWRHDKNRHIILHLGSWALELLGTWSLGHLGSWALGLLGSWTLVQWTTWSTADKINYRQLDLHFLFFQVLLVQWAREASFMTDGETLWTLIIIRDIIFYVDDSRTVQVLSELNFCQLKLSCCCWLMVLKFVGWGSKKKNSSYFSSFCNNVLLFCVTTIYHVI